MGDAAAGDGSVATSEEMLLAVERWSRARKIRIGDYPDPARLWEVTMTRPGTVGITKRDGAGRIDPTVGTKDNALQVAPEVAVAWALAVEAGLQAVDVGPCQACVKRGGLYTWGAKPENEWPTGPGRWLSRTDAAGNKLRRVKCVGWDELTGERLEKPRKLGRSGVVLRWHWVERCEHCTVKAGRDLRTPERLVLDLAVPFASDVETPAGFDAYARKGRREQREARRRAREHLAALADHLQPHAFDTRKPDPAREAAGHALAHLVALWLDGDLRETRTSVEALTAAWERLTVPCEPCRGSGRRGLGHWATWPDRGRRVKCSDCDGHGRVSPTPYRGDAVAGPSPAA